jgi:hypothetical protein
MGPGTIAALGVGAVAGWIAGHKTAASQRPDGERPGQYVARVGAVSSQQAALGLATVGQNVLAVSVTTMATAGPRAAQIAGTAVDAGATFGQNIFDVAARVVRELSEDESPAR